MSEELSDALLALKLMVAQHSQEVDGGYFSAFLTSDAMAMRVLAHHGIMEITDGGMRVVEGKFK